MSKNEFNSVTSQLDKLEKISNQISMLISSGEYEKISHLDKMRKKIINDMHGKNYQYDNNNRKTVLKLISQNQKIISEFKHNEISSLTSIMKQKKCTQAYLATF